MAKTIIDSGHATLDPADIARKFWDVYTARAQVTVNFPG